MSGIVGGQSFTREAGRQCCECLPNRMETFRPFGVHGVALVSIEQRVVDENKRWLHGVVAMEHRVIRSGMRLDVLQAGARKRGGDSCAGRSYS